MLLKEKDNYKHAANFEIYNGDLHASHDSAAVTRMWD